MARPGPARGQLYVGRYLGALAVLVALLYTIVWFAGPGSEPLKPKLGLDLQGGASVILSPKTEAGRAPRQDQLDTAVDIIQRRVNGLGVAEAEVVTQGPNIVVSVPGGTQSSLQTLATTAQLRFREVLDQQPGSPPPVPSGSAAPAPPGSAAPSPSAVVVPSRPASPAPGSISSPRPTTTTNGRPPPPVEHVPAAPGAPGAPGAPAPPASPVPSPTPKAGSASPGATAPGAPTINDGYTGVRSGDVYYDEGFAALDCSIEQARKGGVVEDPNAEIMACSDDGSTKYRLAKAEVVGTDVSGANSGTDQFGTANLVNVQFTGSGQKKFTDLTVKTLNKQVAIVLDGLVLSAPTIQSRIDGDAQISGSFTRKEAQDLANTLKYGALPLTFERSETQVVSATLGDDQLGAGLLAGGLGLLVVVIYSLLYYRMLGFVTITSLLTSGVLVYASVVILGDTIGFALSLAGIAGFIVSVGITADSFVVFFERIKDEIKEGRTPRVAVDRAWVRARRTIISADVVSFLAAIILYFLSVGSVRGFAFTLGLSTLIDVVVVFLFTRPLVSWLSRFSWFTNNRLTGFVDPAGGRPAQTGSRRSATLTPSQEA